MATIANARTKPWYPYIYILTNVVNI